MMGGIGMTFQEHSSYYEIIRQREGFDAHCIKWQRLTTWDQGLSN